VAIQEFPPDGGFGVADCLLYVDGRVASVVEAKKRGQRRACETSSINTPSPRIG
jgi:hypothetical protein